jgi:hypothetical protein
MGDFAPRFGEGRLRVTGVARDGELMNSLVWRFFARKPGHTA